MKQLLETASSLSTPLALAGFFAALFFIIVRQLIARNIFPVLTKQLSTDIFKLIINRFFVLSLVAMILGFIGFLLKYVAPIHSAPLDSANLAFQANNETKISIGQANLNSLIFSVNNPPPGDAITLINGKDISAQLKSEIVFESGKTYLFEGSPDQLNLGVGKNRIIVKYDNVTLPEFEIKYTDMQRQEAQRFYEINQRTEALRKQHENQ
jgi:hypothetical protein